MFASSLIVVSKHWNEIADAYETLRVIGWVSKLVLFVLFVQFFGIQVFELLLLTVEIFLLNIAAEYGYIVFLASSFGHFTA